MSWICRRCGLSSSWPVCYVCDIKSLSDSILGTFGTAKVISRTVDAPPIHPNSHCAPMTMTCADCGEPATGWGDRALCEECLRLFVEARRLCSTWALRSLYAELKEGR